MPLDIKIKTQVHGPRDTTVTVRLIGSLDSATAPQLEKELSAVLDPEVKDLIFDLEQLKFISSAGLRIFATARKFLRQRGEQVTFVHMQPQIEEVFEIVKALPGVSIFGSMAEFDAYLATRQQKIQNGE